MNARFAWLRALTVSVFLLVHFAGTASAETPDADYWKKYGGMPPLDIRIHLDGAPVRGLFESALASKKGLSPPTLTEMMIPVTIGQWITYKVEVSARGKGDWVDVTGHENLMVSNPTQGINIDRKTNRLWVVGDAINAKRDYGYATVIFYYSDLNEKDEQGAYTKLFFDIKTHK